MFLDMKTWDDSQNLKLSSDTFSWKNIFKTLLMASMSSEKTYKDLF